MAKGIQRGETEERAGWANARSAGQATGEKIDYSNRQPLNHRATQKGGTPADQVFVAAIAAAYLSLKVVHAHIRHGRTPRDLSDTRMPPDNTVGMSFGAPYPIRPATRGRVIVVYP